MDSIDEPIEVPWRAKRSQGAALFRICGGASFWRDCSGAPFATVSTDGVESHVEVAGAAFRQWLARRYFDECGGAPSAGALSDAVAFAGARGAFGTVSRPVFIRVGAHEGAIIVDTCDGLGTTVEITAEGWRAVKSCAVAFRWPPGASPLPLPEGGGSVDALRTYINVADDDWPLVAGWIVAAMRPTGPFPVLFLHGEQGSGKSTQARVLRSLVDPNFAPLRAAPRDIQDLAVSAHNSWVVALDNLSSIPVWLSDAVCRLSTGGGFATRALYANDREVVFQAQRPVLVTGIEDIATRGDLMDRSIVVHLPFLSSARRRSEADLWAQYEVARPAIFGALCEAAATALRTPPPELTGGMPRLADFALWASRAASAFGSTAEEFWRTYRRGLAEHSAAAMESSPLARPLLRVALRGPWSGTCVELLHATEAVNGRHAYRGAGWPRTPAAFAGAVRRIAPSLRSVGIDIMFRREAGTGRRLVCLAVTDAALAATQDVAAPGERPCQLGLYAPE